MDFSPAGSDKPVIAVCELCGKEARHVTEMTWHYCKVDAQYPDGHFINPDTYQRTLI